jgi:isocitrate dehydrogenase
MFEAIHGSAPRRAGQNLANPSGLVQGAVLMLKHIGQPEVAERVQNAWLKTIEDGIHTYDIYTEGVSKQKVGTKEFSQAIIANLGSQPAMLKPVSYGKGVSMNLPKYVRKPQAKKVLVGVDVFVHWPRTNPDELATLLKQIEIEEAQLSMITNRGIKVWPDGFSETFCTDHWRCRFKNPNGDALSKADIVQLLSNAVGASIDTIKTENLYSFDGQAAYSLGQGQ